jgi:hypothetical protein
LNLNYDEALPSFASIFNVRRYNQAGKPPGLVGWWPQRSVTFLDNHDTAGRCRLTPGHPRLDRVWFRHLNLTYDKALSNHGFHFNLRRYSTGGSGKSSVATAAAGRMGDGSEESQGSYGQAGG